MTIPDETIIELIAQVDQISLDLGTDAGGVYSDVRVRLDILETRIGSGGGGGGGGDGYSLAQTLLLGNITGGSNIELTAGDSIISSAGVNAGNILITARDANIGGNGTGGTIKLSSGLNDGIGVAGSIILNLPSDTDIVGSEVKFQKDNSSFVRIGATIPTSNPQSFGLQSTVIDIKSLYPGEGGDIVEIRQADGDSNGFDYFIIHGKNSLNGSGGGLALLAGQAFGEA